MRFAGIGVDNAVHGLPIGRRKGHSICNNPVLCILLRGIDSGAHLHATQSNSGRSILTEIDRDILGTHLGTPIICDRSIAGLPYLSESRLTVMNRFIVKVFYRFLSVYVQDIAKVTRKLTDNTLFHTISRSTSIPLPGPSSVSSWRRY